MADDDEQSTRIMFLESLAKPSRPDGSAPAPKPVSDAGGLLPPAVQQRQLARQNGLPRNREHQELSVQRKAASPVPRQRPVPNKSPENRRIADARRDQVALHHIGPFPSSTGSKRRRSYVGIISFILCVVLPCILSGIYFFVFASKQYVAEFRFAVTESDTTSTTSSISGLSSLIPGMTAPNASQNYLVADYLSSREAVDQLQSKINVISLFSQPSIDWWSRFNASKPIEKFVPYWQKMVTASYDQVTGLAIAQVHAFTPDDAYLIASELVKLAEKLVNEIATRPQRDAVQSAKNELARAEERLKNIRAELTKYRDAQSVIDPNSNIVASNTTLAQSLRASLSQLQTELSTLQQQQINRNSPTIQVLQSRIAATKAQLAIVDARVGKPSEGGQSLSSVVGQYEQLDLERQFAQNMVTSTMQALEQARATASSQHLYITPYVRPALPQSSTFPNPYTETLIWTFYCFLAWVLGALLFRSVLERH